MATQEIPKTYEPIVQLLAAAADGARDHGPAVGLKQNTELEIRPELELLIGRAAGPGDTPPAQHGLKRKWNAAKTFKVDAGTALRQAREGGRELATACVNALKARLGTRWSNAWQSAGFTAGTLGIPENPVAVLQQLREYFEANPGHEVPNLSDTTSATADACEAAARAILDAATAVNQSTLAATTAKEELEVGLVRARKRLMGLREELAQLLGRDDKRWYAFGFDRPSDPQTPEVPANLVATPGQAGTGSVFLQWDDARRAENYRVVVRDAAGNELAERLVAESELLLTGLAPGQTVRVFVSARNGRGGESVPAPAVSVAIS